MTNYILIIFLSFWCSTIIARPLFGENKPKTGDPVVSELAFFGKNKVIPEEMQDVILTALSFYPALADTHIEFIYKPDIRKSVMQAQPKVSTLFRRKSKRVYVIKISRYLQLDQEELDVSTLPFEVLVGWIGHELGHIMDYKDRSGLAMMGFGAKYWMSEKFLIGAERRADLYALRHGLGDKIICTKNFVLNHDGISESYKERIKRLYMSPEEFSQMLSEVAP